MLSSSCIQGARTRPSPLVGEKRNFWDSEKFYLRGIKTSRHLFFASTKSILTSRTLKIAKSWCREVLNRELVATAKNWCFTVFRDPSHMYFQKLVKSLPWWLFCIRFQFSPPQNTLLQHYLWSWGTKTLFGERWILGLKTSHWVSKKRPKKWYF